MVKLINEAIDEMLNYPKRNILLEIKSAIKNSIKKVIGKPVYVTERDIMGWPNAMCALGLVEYTKANPNEAISGNILLKICEFYDRWIEAGTPIKKLEDVLGGYVLMELIELIDGRSSCNLGSDTVSKYEGAVSKIYKYLLDARTDSKGVYIYNQSKEDVIVLADMIGMVCPFLSKYAARYNDSVALNICKKQMSLFCELALDNNTGLPYHGYEEKDGINKIGLVGWGRAVGWILMGISISLRYTPEAVDKEYASNLISRVIEIYNSTDTNLFKWSLLDENGHIDTSATAMIAYSLEIITDCYSNEANKTNDSNSDIDINININEKLNADSVSLTKADTRKAISSMIVGLMENLTQSGKVENALAECIGPGVHPQKYGSYPWSVGMTLAAIAKK